MNTTEHAEPGWLLAAADQRLAELKQAMPVAVARELMGGVDLLMTPLTEPAEGSSKIRQQMWEHTCDHCGKYLLVGLYIGHVLRQWDGLPIQIHFGACGDCLEVVDHE